MPSHTEIIHSNFFDRIKEAITGIPIGILMIVIAAYVLFIGEKRHAETTILLNDSEPNTHLINSKNINPDFDSQLVLVNDSILTKDKIVDPLFNIKGKYLKLFREVKMCQWQEEIIKSSKKDLLGGKTDSITYKYHKTWNSDTINSDKFKYKHLYKNPKAWKYQSAEFSANHVTLGAFKLDQEIVSELDKYTPIIPSFAKANFKIETDTFKCLSVEVASDAAIYSKHKLHGQFIYEGTESAKNPKIGDYKIVYWAVIPEIYTLVSEQSNDSLKPKRVEHGFSMSELNCGTNFNNQTDKLQLILSGTKTKEEMYHWANDKNNILYVIGYRLWGFIFMAGGFKKVFKTLAILPAWLPVIGGFAGKIILKLSFLISTSISFLIAGTSWLIYNKFENISRWDYYFLILLFLIFIGGINVRASIGDHSVNSEDLFET